MDRESGRSRGFGFITFTSTEAASSALQAYDGQVLKTSFHYYMLSKNSEIFPTLLVKNIYGDVQPIDKFPLISSDI